MPPRTNRSDDRHTLKTLGGIRLDNADDDTWIRGYAKQTGQSLRKVVIAAVKHYRRTVEHNEHEEQT